MLKSRTPSQPDDGLLPFCDGHYKRVFCYFLRRCRNEDVAEDLTQETFLKFCPKYYAVAPAKREAYLWRTAHSVWCDYLKKQKRPPGAFFDLADLTDTIPEEEDSRERSGQLLAAIAKLTPLEQQVIVLRYFVGLSFAAIARFLGRPAGTIRSAHTRAIQKLRRLLGDVEDE
jgi:RNA polymerase sigma-70 factor (ECF subfamily)